MQRNKSVRCILVPQRGRLLILPSAVVAEVLFDQAVEPYKVLDVPWVIGAVRWRESLIPLIDFAALSAERQAESLDKTRALVVTNIANDHPEHYALVIDRVPRVESLDAATLEQSNDHRKASMHCVAARVFIDNRPGDIPDMDALGQKLAEALAQSATS